MAKTRKKAKNPLITVGNFIAWGVFFVTPFQQNAESTTSLPPEIEEIFDPVLVNGHQILAL